MFDRAEFFGFACDAEVEGQAMLSTWFSAREGTAELVERGFVGIAGHVHEAFLEGGRGFFEDRVAAGFEARCLDGARAQAGFAAGDDRGEERAEAGAAA